MGKEILNTMKEYGAHLEVYLVLFMHDHESDAVQKACLPN